MVGVLLGATLLLSGAAHGAERLADPRTKCTTARASRMTYDVAANLGEVEAHLNKPRQAAELLSYALRSAPPSVKPAQRERTRHFLDEAKTKVHALRLNVSPKEAHVTLDGAPVDPALVGEAMQAGEAHRGGDDVFVDPGEHAVEVALEGYTSQRQPLMALAGTTQMFAFYLKRTPVEVKAPPPPAGSGSGATPTPPALPPPLPVKRSPVPAIVLGGLAVGAAAAGIGLFVASSGKKSDALMLNATIDKDHGRCAMPGPIDSRCADIVSAARDASAFHNAGVGLFVAAGALAAGTLTYLLWPAPKPKKLGTDVRPAPLVTIGGGGVVMGGRF